MSDILSDAGNAERRVLTDRPSPAIPLLVMAAVVLGAIAMALLWPREIIPAQTTIPDSPPAGTGDSSMVLIGSPAFRFDFWPGMIYWAIASVVAYVLITLIAKRQGYRSGIWVNRLPLVASGLTALAVALIAMFSSLSPDDLLIRGYLPVLAMTVAIVIWGLRERQPALWAFGTAVTTLAVTANLYNMENLLFRLGMPGFSASIDVVNLAVMAAALLLGSAGFALAHASGPRHALRGAR